MEERILKDGQVRPGDILKVDSFLNHQLDVAFLAETGKAFYEHFEGHGINKILSCMAAQYFRVSVLFAKKAKSRNLDNDLYTAVARSYTYGIDNTLTVSKRFLTSDDHVLIMDDFLANGNAVGGLLDLCAQAGASVAGIAIAIEKGYQGGGDALRFKGYDVFSLAIIDEMNESGIRFR